MEKLLFSLLLIFSMNAECQRFNQFEWQGDKATFSSVQLKVIDGATKKVVFDGYKDSKIEFRSNVGISPTLDVVYIKLAGYFYIESGDVMEFQCKVKKSLETIVTYSVAEGNKLASVKIFYDDRGRVFEIVVAENEDIMQKKGKTLIFVLTGFE